jgi:hypothetical protein
MHRCQRGRQGHGARRKADESKHCHDRLPQCPVEICHTQACQRALAAQAFTHTSSRALAYALPPPCHTRKFPRRLALCRALCSLLLRRPATTPTPHSPVSVCPGADASSVIHAVEPVPFVPAPTPQQKTPKDPRTTTRKPPSVTAPPQHTRKPSHNPRLAPTPTCPLPSAPQAREPRPAITHAPTRSALSQARTPYPGRTRLARTPARALPRPAAATPLPRHSRRTHLSPLAQVKMPRPCLMSSR